jgi:cob(I)alamin adenosyltransferase
MISNLVELYGELESAKNKVNELLSLLSVGREQDDILKNVYEFIYYWHEVGLDKVSLNFDVLMQGNLNDLNAFISLAKKRLQEYNENMYSFESLRGNLLYDFKMILRLISELQSRISEFSSKELYSNKLLKAKFDELLNDYRMFIRIISPMIKLDSVDIERALSMRGYTIDTVNQFIDDFVAFANHLGIEIIPQTVYTLVNTLYQKHSYKEYMQKLKEIKNWFDSIFAEMSVKLKNK